MYKRVTFYCLFFFVNVLALITFIGCRDKVQPNDVVFENEETYTDQDVLSELGEEVFDIDNTGIELLDYTITPREDGRSNKKDVNQEKQAGLFM